jgi:hypothetical protein
LKTLSALILHSTHAQIAAAAAALRAQSAAAMRYTQAELQHGGCSL